MEADYKVYMTEQAIQQVQEIITYISRVLMARSTAERWADYLQGEIASLCTMPYRFPLVDDPVWSKKGLRKMSAKNFNVYFHVQEAGRQVWVIAVIYAKRDQIAALGNIE